VFFRPATGSIINARQDERKTDRALSLFYSDTTFIENELSMFFYHAGAIIFFLLFFVGRVS
jgi:hypothetical protein